jgi:hypothetical protein
LADQEITKPPDLIYEDTGGIAPAGLLRHRGAYGPMHGTIEVELATRILVPKPHGSTEVRFLSSSRLRFSPNAAANWRSGLEAAGAAAARTRCRLQAELTGLLLPACRLPLRLAGELS